MSAFGSAPVRSVALVGILLVATVLGAAVAALPAASAGATPVAVPDSWAYGVQKWFNFTVSTPHGVHAISAFMAWYTVFHRVNVSATVTELSVERTVLSNYTAQYCAPSCGSPDVAVRLNHAAYEHALGWLNLTSEGTVYENGVAVPAVAVLNSSAELDSWARSSANISVATPQGTKEVSEAFRATGAAVASLDFTPALGLLPLDLAVGDSWHATSAYVGAAAWSVNWTYVKTNASGATVSLSGNPNETVAATGTLSVEGSVVGQMTLPHGMVLPVVTLDPSGAFYSLDGVILLPDGAGFLDGSAHPWDGYRMGFASMRGDRVALELTGGGGGFEVRAASGDYATNDSTPAMGDGMRSTMGGGSGLGGLGPAAASATGVPSTPIVAAPMDPAVAAAAAAGLATLAGPTLVGPSGAAGSFPWGYVAVGAVGAGAAVGAAAVILLGRRRTE